MFNRKRLMLVVYGILLLGLVMTAVSPNITMVLGSCVLVGIGERWGWRTMFWIATAMKKAGMDAIGMTFAVDYVTLKYKGHAWERFLNALAEQDTILMDNHIARALNADDAINGWKSG